MRINTDRKKIMDRAHAYAAKCPPAISGSDGHGQTFAVTCTVQNGFDLTDDETLEILRGYNENCSPPWSERELIHKVQQARKTTHQKPSGYLLEQNGLPRRVMTPSAPPAPSESETWDVDLESLPAVAKKADPAQGAAFDIVAAEIPTICDHFSPLVPVVGCKIGRPAEINVDDATWRALEAAGFAHEPQVQLALWMFGPGCQIVTTEDRP